ncbi:MAG TPA: type ISP restriction/modification enzyme [Acidobacteriota bacterium]|nr:type ISP restriction/modification enzyme [Acidobacteriota bacterium]
MVEEDLTFDYSPDELGIAPGQAVGIKEIKQLRPMEANQPWGIFWINFEKKRLPVVILRRILGHLVIKKRASAKKASQRTWHASDLLFISAYGEDNDRAITFAHFAQDAGNGGDLPVLKVLGWDGGDTVLHLADAHRTLTEKLRWPDNPDDLADWRDQWSSVFTLRHQEVISTTQALVEELAKLATSIRKRVDAILSRESERGPMRRLYAAFKTALIHDLSEHDFADVIAQTISYGLLAARFSSKGGISIKSLVEMIPPTNPFLRELLGELLAVAGRKKGAFDFDELGIQDVVDLLNQANAEAVKSDFGNRTRNEDPVIHFYEHFLKAYDKKKKVQRGVFFTPQPVVSYIVRSVHELLQTEFGLEDGLADTTTWGEMVKRNKDLKIPEGAKPGDPFVLILDPATGTATFLVEVIEVIFTQLKTKWTDLGRKPAEISKLWNEYVPKNLLPRLYGYELMMAPYTIAHMKLALKLQEINARLGQPDFQFMYTDRAHIYLTNSLEPAGDNRQGVLEGIFPALAHEAQAVSGVKRNKRFTVIVGNPPYSKLSTNFNEWIDALLHGRGDGAADTSDYYCLDGAPMGEKTVWLQDDYIKFMRLSQHLIVRSGLGLHGYITNNGYLDNPTLRGMRQQLGLAYGNLYLLDLHGSTKRGETGAQGGGDENVFDIQQGVAIGIFSRAVSPGAGVVRHADLFGARTRKYAFLSRGTISQSDWEVLQPCSSFYLFVPVDVTNQAEYEAGWRVTDVFAVQHCGIITKRDALTIGWTAEDVYRTVSDFSRIPPETARKKYNLPEDVRDWKVEWAQDDLRSCGITRDRVIRILYRPFDVRFTYFTGRSRGFVGWPVADVTRLMLSGQNLGLVTTRMTKGESFHHVLVCRHMSEVICLSAKTSNNGFIFPLYQSSSDLDGPLFARSRNRTSELALESNIAPDFLRSISASVQLAFVPFGRGDLKATFGPEDVFSYLVAVLHSPSYRLRYREFLSRDFPRLPLTSSLNLFRALAKLGGELVALHLMESPKLDKHITKWIGSKNPEVEKITYSDETVWTDKAQSEGFRGVQENVWAFCIGGYQVCQKWLKDRKGRTLSSDDITHYHRIVVAISETIGLMAEIDDVIQKHGGWPGAFH